MTTNLPESDRPDLREYLFVDAPRVRMLLSQLRNGAPETATSTESRSHRLGANLKFLSAERSGGHSDEDVIALSDLHVSMLEEDAEALGVLTDLSDKASEPKFWKRGGLRKTLEPGMLIRATAPTRILDASAVTRVWRNFEEAGGEEDADFSQIMSLIEALYGENIALTVMPCGPNEPGNAFLGVIGHETDSVALDRASLLSRIGPETPELTIIMQIARVPTIRSEGVSSGQLIDQLTGRLEKNSNNDDEPIDRNAIDQLLFEMMRTTEDAGLQSAPQWPAVAVTPLAIYRQMPGAPDLDTDDDLAQE